MYVYYQSYKFKSAFYTHRITVHENANGRLREILESKYGYKAVTWSRRTGKLYVRETLRIARVHRSKERDIRGRPLPKKWHFATSRNFGLSIYAEIDSELGQRICQRYNFMDDSVARRTST